MSNLIKLKQIEDGTKIKQHEGKITALEGLVGKTSVESQIQAAQPDVYQVTSNETSIDALVALLPEGTVAKAGDILIATNSLGVKSAYHYDDAADKWIACDGNVDASAVILTQDITLAGDYTQVGTLTKDATGIATFATSGKSVQAALIEMLSQRLQPTITADPSINLTFSQAKAYEVGTSVTPSYSVSLDDGSYTYSDDTGVTATSWIVTDTNGASNSHASATASGSFDAFNVKDGENYKITAKVTYGNGNIALDNLGDPSADSIQIKGATISKEYETAITGYRKPFWGYKLTADALANPAAITSAQVWALQKTVATSGSSQSALPTSYTVPADTKQVFFLAKSGVKNSISVKNASSLNSPVAFTKVTGIQVADKNGNDPVDYDMWYVNFGESTSGSAELKITWG